MAVQPQFLAYILEQLELLGRLRSRRMFGAVGLYSGELFFGIIDDDTLFFKSDDSNSADYTMRNMPQFMPSAHRPEAVMAYYQVPADIIEDAESLVAWARKSVAVALAARAAKSRPKARKTVRGKIVRKKKGKTVRKEKGKTARPARRAGAARTGRKR